MPSQKRWKEEELSYLSDNWYEAISDLSDHLGKAKATVKKQLEAMGYERPAGRTRAYGSGQVPTGSEPREVCLTIGMNCQ